MRTGSIQYLNRKGRTVFYRRQSSKDMVRHGQPSYMNCPNNKHIVIGQFKPIKRQSPSWGSVYLKTPRYIDRGIIIFSQRSSLRNRNSR